MTRKVNILRLLRGKYFISRTVYKLKSGDDTSLAASPQKLVTDQTAGTTIIVRVPSIKIPVFFTQHRP